MSNNDHSTNCYTYKRWSQIRYPGESSLPEPVEPLAGTWPLYYLKRLPGGWFANCDGRSLNLEICRPTGIDFDEELKAVECALHKLTDKRIQIAEYWGEGPPTKQWTPIIDRLIDTYKLEAPRAGRVLAAVQAGINDAFVVCWHLKYLWDVARPNQLNNDLHTVLPTPKHPTYPSGHATISGTAEVILSYFFAPEAKRLKMFAEENALSRLYAGVHFPSDNFEGLQLGRQIGKIVVDKLKKQRNGEGVSVDKIIAHNYRAELPPPPYKQVIPFP